MPRIHLAACTSVAAVGLLLVPASAASAVPKPSPTPTPSPAAAPQLSIAIDDGRTQTADGELLTYKVTVRNVGTSEVSSLAVTQTLPAGLTFQSADHDGAAEAGAITWSVTIAPGGQATMSSIGKVGQTGPELFRLASVVCAADKPGGRAFVCATDSDLLPAGAAAPAARTGLGWVWYVAGACVLAAAAAAGLVVRRRRRVALAATDKVAADAGERA